MKRRNALAVLGSTLAAAVFGPIKIIVGIVRVAERFLTPNDDWVAAGRKTLLRGADSVLSPLGFPTVRKKSNDDYIVTADVTADEIERALVEAGYQRNVLSTRKYRQRDEGQQWAIGSWVYDPADTDWQHHVYLFPADDGIDVYGHRETSVREGMEHRTNPDQTHGDPNGRVRAALHEAGIDYEHNS